MFDELVIKSVECKASKSSCGSKVNRVGRLDTHLVCHGFPGKFLSVFNNASKNIDKSEWRPWLPKGANFAFNVTIQNRIILLGFGVHHLGNRQYRRMNQEPSFACLVQYSFDSVATFFVTFDQIKEHTSVPIDVL